MEEPETFAYLLLSCIWSPEWEEEVSGWYYGDLIEVVAESEDQAAEPTQLWLDEWKVYSDRITPVQLTLGWDVRPYLLATFSEYGVTPGFRSYDATFGDRDNILYFDHPLPSLENANQIEVGQFALDLDISPPAPLLPEQMVHPADKNRFDAVLNATAELARRQDRGLLFVGGWGWYYEMVVPAVTKSVMRQAGWIFTDRHA
jgi:hypothetical protein